MTQGGKRNRQASRKSEGDSGGYDASYKEIAKEIGCSIEGARQLEIRALAKLRKGLDDAGLTFQDFVTMLNDEDGDE